MTTKEYNKLKKQEFETRKKALYTSSSKFGNNHGKVYKEVNGVLVPTSYQRVKKKTFSPYKKVKKTKKVKLTELQRTSLGERKIYEFLQNSNIKCKREYIFKDCFNPTTGEPLRFDFYIKSKNIAIEFDGIQHYQYVPEFHGSCPDKGAILLKKQKYRDSLKDQYCLKNNITLIRIPHWNLRTIPDILEKALNEKRETQEI